MLKEDLLKGAIRPSISGLPGLCRASTKPAIVDDVHAGLCAEPGQAAFKSGSHPDGTGVLYLSAGGEHVLFSTLVDRSLKASGIRKDYQVLKM